MFNFNDLTDKMIARFWAKVDSSGGPAACWPYMGGRKKANGYGTFFAKRATPGKSGKSLAVNAHKFAYVVSKGQVPEGLIVRHKCDNPPCCNPDHLILGTYHDNNMDTLERGRIDRVRCAENARKNVGAISRSKRLLSERDIAAIIIARSQGHSCNVISEMYSITGGLIRMVSKAKCYQDFPIVQRLGELHKQGIRFQSYPRNQPFECLHPDLQAITQQAIRIIENARAVPSFTMPTLTSTLSRAERLIRQKLAAEQFNAEMFA